jgi:predicted Rossmann fold nucleotide-binding protein DprA/Smf involved in DNA uptake
MGKAGFIYRRTLRGRQASAKEDTALPPEFRRILAILGETEMHSDVVRSNLANYSATVVFGWLAELEERGLVEALPSAVEHDLDFSGNFNFSKLRSQQKSRT